jgi:hypothetical protein
MKPGLLLLSCGLVTSISLAAQTPAPPVKLVGVVHLSGYKCTVLGIEDPRPGWTPPDFTLREGERNDSVELLRIFPERGAVELRVGGSNLVAALPGEAINVPSGVPAIAFAGVSFKSALEIYAELSGRSLLRSPTLRNLALSFRALAGDKGEAAKVLSDAFSTNGIAVIPDGDKFALVVRKEEVRFFHARSTEIKQSSSDTRDREMIPARGVVLEGADFRTVAMLYAQMSARKINPANWDRNIPNPNFFFKNQTPLTKAELLYAYDTMFELNGLKWVPDGHDFIKPVPFGPK